MNRTLKILISIFVILIALSVFYYYTIYCDIIVIDAKTTPYQYHHLILLFFSCVITAFALIVALLKDEIRSLWKYAKIKIDLLDLTETIVRNSPTDIKASLYDVTLVITNTGSIPAKECSIFLTKLTSRLHSGNINNIDISNSPELIWRGKNQQKIIIPPKKCSAEVSLIKIISNNPSDTKDAQSQQSLLEIAGIEANKDFRAETGNIWNLTLMIYSESFDPVNFQIEFQWNGQWENRLTEMKQCVTFNRVQKKIKSKRKQ